ncbi:hypothetical protein N1851_019600 [Merluccius polli]|uniref:DRBM domain-containing protein n=1 Tax=Merluccius polli TaxID=89951 RepID=A0AA47MLV0_MERPO|nr:hypothetical protein N1851_019600 [Merluccius polli]
MDSSGSSSGGGHMRRFEDEGYKTWIKTTMILECLKTRLAGFLENETAAFHQTLSSSIRLNQNECGHVPRCDFKSNQHLCPFCHAWRDAILDKHTAKRSQVYWNNSTPHLWHSHKWEVAKVYMPRGNKNHKLVDDFDISAFLNLMTFCGHFQNFVKRDLVTEVTNVRNKVMHSASFQVSAEDFQQYVGRIQALGEALGQKVPEFQSFSKDVAEVQNIDFRMKFRHSGKNIVKYDSRSILNIELKIMKDKMECLAQLYNADRENMLTSEELQKVRGFLDRNHDLREGLRPQWQRLEAVQAQQGQQIDKLTNRVGELEKHTEVTTEFSTEPIMYKNRLLERAARYKWHEPVFSELDESTGFRGQVEVNGKKILGSQVCKSKQQAHQEVSKKALQELGSVMAIEEAALCQDQSQTVSQAGPYFFAAVTVSLGVDVSPDKGGSAPVDREEYAYQKLVSLFGLEPSSTGLSNKEEVLQYCRELNVPPPVERRSSDCFVLRLNGQITFYDLEGSKRKGQAEQQAARAALKALCGVLDTAEVFRENHKGALAELLVRFKQAGKPDYRVTERLGGRGERVTWLPGEDPTASQVVGPTDSGHGNKEGEDGDEADLAAIESPMKRMWTSCSDIPSKMTKVLPSTDENDLPNSGRYLGSVQVTIQVDLQPCQATDEEGAVVAAYSDLMKALSLSPASASSDGEKQAVVDFFSQTRCHLPVAKIDPTPNGTYSCSLSINGKLTFQSPVLTSIKKEAEQLAAKEALAHLEGLQTVKNIIKLPGEVNCKGRLQEVAARLGNISHPMYFTADGGIVTDIIVSDGRFLGSVQLTIQVDLPPCQATDQEGAVEAAYSDLTKALSLSPASASSGAERQAVLEFLELTQCPPLVEKIETATSGTYQCALKIDGQFTFHSPERTSTKKEAERLAARQALKHLEGLLSVDHGLLPGYSESVVLSNDSGR